jgi:two-component system, OmpR family, response regulator TctD
VHILLAEKDDRLAAWLMRELEQMRFTVDHVSDGKSAEQTLHSNVFDAILLGWDLPFKAGSQLLSELRASRNMTPVLVIADTDTVEERVASFNTGADDYLSRPLQAPELVARLNAVMRRSAVRPDKCLRCGALVYNSDTLLFQLDGAHLALTPREHAILVALMERAGSTVSRNTITQRVFSLDAQRCYSGIETLVHRLRKKLGGGFVTIETVRELGYRLVESRPVKE